MLFTHNTANHTAVPWRAFFMIFRKWIGCFLLAHIVLAGDAQGRFPALTAKVNFIASNASVGELLESIQKQTDYTFSFEKTVMNNIAMHDVRFSQANLGTVLQYVEENYDIVFSVMDKNIAVRKNGQKKTISDQNTSGSGSLKGRIVDFETSQPLPGAAVVLSDAGKATASDDKGYYNLGGIKEGSYTLIVTYLGYTATRQSVTISNGATVVDVKMQSGGGTQLNEVVVSSAGRKARNITYTTDRQIVQAIKNAQSVVSGISSEQISKSADRNAAQVMQRVAGVTIKDDKFVIIRGMSERYNLTYLNDNVAPSTEVYSRAFSMDLIPSRIIDRILVYKSPAPDLLADMTGGAVKIYTKDARNVKHLDIEFQTGIRPGTTGNPHFLVYQGGKYDFLGFDDGLRKLPSAVPSYGNFTRANISQSAYAQSFSPILQYGQKTAAPNLQLTVNYYNTFRAGHSRISMLSSFSYKNELQHSDIYRQQGAQLLYPAVLMNASPTLVGKIIFDNQNAQAVQLNLLQNFIWHLHDSSNIQLKNFLLQQGQTGTEIRTTYGPGILSDTGVSYQHVGRKDNILSYAQRFLYVGNLGGNHYWQHGRQYLQWNAGYTYSRQDIPDQRVIRLINHGSSNLPGPDYDNKNLNWMAYGRMTSDATTNLDIVNLGIISRVWIRNTEGVYNASADYTWKYTSWLTAKAGTYQQWKERVLYRKIFTVNEGDLTGGFGDYQTANGYSGAYTDYEITRFKEQDLGKVWSAAYLRDDASGLKVYDRTSGADAYKASEQNNSAYIALSALPFGSKLDIYGGVRVEYDQQKVAGAIPPAVAGQLNRPILVDIKKLNWLPSVNIGYRPSPGWVLRGAYGKTVNRPEFRELSPYQERDYANNQFIQGNTDLRPADIDNYDLRLEWYPGDGKSADAISIGGFRKELVNPIERTIYQNVLSANPPFISFQNAKKADINGLELDIRKSFSFIPGRFFKNLSIIANGALMKSTVNKEEDIVSTSGGVTTVTHRVIINRDLQGQAPYIINAGIYYDNAATGTKISAIYNRVGTRIYAASTGKFDTTGNSYSDNDLGSLLELPRDQFDVSITQRLVKSLQIKCSIQNLLNAPVRMAEDANFTYKYEKPELHTLKSATGITYQRYSGDLLASEYRPRPYYVCTITYVF